MDCIKKCFVLIIIFSVALPMFGQGNEWNLWTSMKINHKLTKALRVGAATEFRFKNNLSEFDRWGVALNAEYQLLSFLKAEAGYEFHYRNRGDDGWKTRQRYMVGAIASANWNLFKFSLRERFQQTFDQGNIKTRLRSRVEVAFAPRNSIFSPYFSIELYQRIGHQSFWKIDRLRYRPGVDIKLTKNWGIDLFYCYQHEPAVDKNIVGIECSYAF